MPTTVVHCKREPFDIYIGRRRGPEGKWGNPYSHLAGTIAKYRVPTLEESIRSYEAWILKQPELMSALHELRGKALGCWCKPKDGFNGRLLCHGQVLAKLADAITE